MEYGTKLLVKTKYGDILKCRLEKSSYLCYGRTRYYASIVVYEKNGEKYDGCINLKYEKLYKFEDSIKESDYIKECSVILK